MPVDFRYHVISLVAVFCALAIGVLVGFSMGTSPGLEERIDALYELFDEKIEVLTDQVQTSKDFVKAVTPLLLRDRLVGREITIIVARPDDDARQAARSLTAAIESAGGQVNSVIYVERRFYRLSGTSDSDRARRERVAQLLSLDASDPDAFPRLVAARLAAELVAGTRIARDVESQGRVIRFADDRYAGGADSVVLIGGLTDRDEKPVETFDLPVIAACQQLYPAVRVVACEMSEAPVSAIAPYKQAKAHATVDNVETAYGRAAVVLALQGKEGHFGIKDTAESLLPPIDAASTAAQP